MPKPRPLRLVRPQNSIEEFIREEGWCMTPRRMVLLEQAPMETDSMVRFDLSLKSGEKLIRAEAVVLGYQPGFDGKPGGPKVRFKRFGAGSREFVQRVIAEYQRNVSDPVLTDPPPAPEPSKAPSSARQAAPKEAPPPKEVPPPLEFSEGDLTTKSRPPGSRPKVVTPPENRDGLLDKLRQRTERLAKTRPLDDDAAEHTG